MLWSPRSFGELYRRSGDAGVSGFREHFASQGLRVVDDFVEAANGRTGYTEFGENFRPFGTGARAKNFGDEGLQHASIFNAQSICDVVGMIGQIGAADRRAERAPEFLTGNRNHDFAVLG